MRTSTPNYQNEMAKIDLLATSGLSGTYNSLAYRVHEIEKHFHNAELAYGNASNAMAENTPVKFTVTGGDNAWGTEVLLTDGTVIESGNASKYFDINTLYITDVSAANKISILELITGEKGTAIETVVTTAATDLFTKEGHGLTDNDTVYLSVIDTTTGINTYTVYHVISVAGNDFQLSLTQGGGAVTLTNDGTCTVVPITETVSTDTVISMAAVNSDSMPFAVICPRVPCNRTVSVRAKSETGSTIAIGFLIGLHSYTN